ncbi:MAG: RNA polymerase sigma factor [bacterium]|nr:RNA polymerase sigma factor [bacterium]
MEDRHKDRECPDFAAMAQRGEMDESLLEQIIHCFGQRLQRFAAYRCEDGTLAEDALQDAMINLIENIDSYRGDAPIEPWLRRLVVSACSHMRRGRKNASALHRSLDEDLAREIVDPVAEKEVAVSSLSSELIRIEEAIRGLPEPNRSLLLKHEAEEVPLEELAAEFNLSLDAVKSRLKRSRAKLREQLAWLKE